MGLQGHREYWPLTSGNGDGRPPDFELREEIAIAEIEQQDGRGRGNSGVKEPGGLLVTTAICIDRGWSRQKMGRPGRR
jgi:hypothetical protein